MAPRTDSSSFRRRAADLGFDAVGVTGLAGLDDNGLRLRQFVELGRHGEMGWMEETLERRVHPKAMWPDARSAVVLAMNYGPEGDTLANLTRPEVGNISVYARHRDYHDVLKGRLKDVAGVIARDTGAEVKVFVDTAPLMEKPLAARAGLGWQGKHTNLVSRQHGSWLFLGVILTQAELEADEPERDHCGSCRACLDACPTQAFPAPYQIDARRCISYLTIEHDGPIPDAFRRAIGNRIYGCDDCLAACPWNKFAQSAREMKLKARPDLLAPPLAELALLDDAAFRALFSGSPVKRIGRARFLRNVAIAIGNSADRALLPSAERLAGDPDPLVREAGAWAANELAQVADTGE
ncbi:tRNA epoxyqueuosine(34) reductase QueG [Oryzibacter oryziterrae]|uniref:tRNA epoxyqueuosine(34) reductase QueG n=1 Tax=Oryzibacter oryziterrae TaxID=2766474 RepID=UPI001F01EF68|nr:tRNA epoxyqueuosine(34) reductase QueG [Oryzibacter oryziterrae]